MNINQDIFSKQYQAREFDNLLDDLVTEIEIRNNRVTRINHIDNIYERRQAGMDVVIGFHRYKIVEFCNLSSCSELISAGLSAGVFMPVRFVIYQQNEADDIHIAFLKPNGICQVVRFETDDARGRAA